MTKIALVTEDGRTLSQRFGFAPTYVVVTAEHGRATAREERSKPHHPRSTADHDNGRTGFADMFAPIADCDVLIVGGMGVPAYHRAQERGLSVILTEVGDMEDALEAYLDGRLAPPGDDHLLHRRE